MFLIIKIFAIDTRGAVICSSGHGRKHMFTILPTVWRLKGCFIYQDYVGKIESMKNTSKMEFCTNLKANWLFILTEAGGRFGAGEHLAK